MSMTEQAPEAEPQRTTPAGIWEHPCCHDGCTKWGGFGYQEPSGVQWYCGEHRHVAEERRR